MVIYSSLEVQPGYCRKLQPPSIVPVDSKCTFLFFDLHFAVSFAGVVNNHGLSAFL
jgi:hypothetical protein